MLVTSSIIPYLKIMWGFPPRLGPRPHHLNPALATCLVALLCIYQTILWFVFDLIYVMIVSSRAFYLSELTKLLITFLSMILSIPAQLSELICFHIKCSAKC